MPAIQACDFNLVASKEAAKQTDAAENGAADEGLTQPKAFFVRSELGRAAFRTSDFIELVGHNLFFSERYSPVFRIIFNNPFFIPILYVKRRYGVVGLPIMF